MTTAKHGRFTVKTNAQGITSIYIDGQCILECTIADIEALTALLDAVVLVYNIQHET